MRNLNHARTYMAHQLNRLGYYCTEPQHLDVTALVVGKGDTGFIVIFNHVDPMEMQTHLHSPKVAALPEELKFLKLRVKQVHVTPGQYPDGGESCLLVVMDSEMVDLLKQEKPGDGGFLYFKKPELTTTPVTMLNSLKCPSGSRAAVRTGRPGKAPDEIDWSEPFEAKLSLEWTSGGRVSDLGLEDHAWVSYFPPEHCWPNGILERDGHYLQILRIFD